jgi:hypothetical protein
MHQAEDGDGDRNTETQYGDGHHGILTISMIQRHCRLALCRQNWRRHRAEKPPYFLMPVIHVVFGSNEHPGLGSLESRCTGTVGYYEHHHRCDAIFMLLVDVTSRHHVTMSFILQEFEVISDVIPTEKPSLLRPFFGTFVELASLQ